MDIDTANQTAVNRMMEARPILKAVAPARDVIPGMKENLLLHAGPPNTVEALPHIIHAYRERGYRFVGIPRLLRG